MGDVVDVYCEFLERIASSLEQIEKNQSNLIESIERRTDRIEDLSNMIDELGQEIYKNRRDDGE